MRIWGTIGFAAGSQPAGLLHEKLFPGSVYLAFFIFILASAFGVLNTKTTAEAGPPEDKPRAGAGQILTNRRFLYYLLLASMLYKIVSAIVSPRCQLTALALVSALSKNFTTIVMQNIGGAIVDSLSVSRLFLIMAGISLAGLLLSCLIRLPDTRREKMFS